MEADHRWLVRREKSSIETAILLQIVLLVDSFTTIMEADHIAGPSARREVASKL
jgi:hypothetical protein